MRVLLGKGPNYIQTSVEEANGAPSITIAPNPAHESIRIATHSNGLSTIAAAGSLNVELIALTGEVVCKGQGHGALTLDVSAVATGAYLLKVMSDGSITSRMVVVQ
jgi:hypothetical protein